MRHPPLPDTQLVRSFGRSARRFADWMREKNWSEQTITHYGNSLGPLLRFLVETAPDWAGISQVSRESLESYAQGLHSAENERGGFYAVTSIRARLTCVKALFRFLHRAGEIRVDPAALLELPKSPKRLPRSVLTEAEMRRLLGSPDLSTALGLRDRAILELLYSSGLRNAELRAVGLDDFDFSRGLVVVRQGKGRKDRVVPMGEAAARYVEKYVNQGRHRIAPRATDRRAFLTFRGNPLAGEDLGKLVRIHAKRAGIKKNVTPHALRHTCATAMLRGRADIRHIQALLGHASLNSTEIYTHVEIGDLKRVHQRTHPREQDPGELPKTDAGDDA